MVKCEICGFEMKTRLNGSHLKRKHNIDIHSYLKLYPNADVGVYPQTSFKCAICGDVVYGSSANKLKHLKSHGIENIHEYNIKYEIKKCECGCGKITEYSYKTGSYRRYANGCYTSWNDGLSKETDVRVFNSNAGGWNKNLTKDNNEIMLQISNKMVDFWKENPEVKLQVVNSQRKVMLEKYGVENPNDYPEFWYKFKIYEFPSGAKVKVQGYENYGIDLLLERYTESDICVDRKKIPRFNYNNTKTYTPDIYVSSNNTVYEIKSTWTAKIFKNKSAKIKSVLNAGYNYTIITFDGKLNYTIEEHKI
jgi:hypothetical protein